MEADNLFFSVTGPQMERNFAPEWRKPRVSHMPGLDDLGDKIWDFLSWWYLDEIGDLQPMLEWIETLGNVGKGWRYFACGMHMNIEGPTCRP